MEGMEIWLLLLLLLCSPSWGQSREDNPYYFAPQQHKKLSQPDSCSLEELAEMLSSVTQVHGSGVTFGNFESDTHCCYRRLLESGEVAIPSFLKVLERGTPAGRLYACMGLMRLGREEMARDGLTQLLACKGKIVYVSGCSRETLEAAVLAQSVLDKPERDF